jgi:acetyl esterase/lipase
MASHGWLCSSIDYRLSPRATFPDHVVDVKRAIRWLKEHAREHGADPDFIVVTGGSAGGHLASLAALTPNAPEFQPGFAGEDTTVQGCVSFYGVYDFTNRNGVYRHEGLAGVLSRWVMKCKLDEARERYEQASPLYRVGSGAPPFFLVHGDLDSLVPVAEARHFHEALRDVSRAPVVYAEIPGAQHAFEIFPSLRSALAIDGVERFLFVVYSEFLRRAESRDGAHLEPDRQAAAS